MPITPEKIRKQYDFIVIGGGFYGCIVAEQLGQYGRNVLLVEKGADLMQRASYVNQARIHQGYHYPRSILTSLRSRINFPEFIKDYSSCVYSDFKQYYAVGRMLSKITASQFRLFCERIGAPYKDAPKNVKKLFNENLIEDLFEVKEYAFDAAKLKNIMLEKLEAASVHILLNGRVEKICSNGDKLTISIDAGEEITTISAERIFNCCYSKINQIMNDSKLPLIPLKHELTEIALIEMPDILKRFSVTIMDGPFFSIMPFPARQLHSLSHVRYTPHYSWQDDRSQNYFDADIYVEKAGVPTHYKHMIMDAQRYLPVLEECRYIESLWEVKTVLPKSEIDDSRPILFKQSEEIPGLISIMGGKIDNIYDVKARIDEEIRCSQNLQT